MDEMDSVGMIGFRKLQRVLTQRGLCGEMVSAAARIDGVEDYTLGEGRFTRRRVWVNFTLLEPVTLRDDRIGKAVTLPKKLGIECWDALRVAYGVERLSRQRTEELERLIQGHECQVQFFPLGGEELFEAGVQLYEGIPVKDPQTGKMEPAMPFADVIGVLMKEEPTQLRT